MTSAQGVFLVKRVLIPAVLCLTGAVMLSSLATGQAATKVLPSKVTLKATPKKDLKRPYVFKLSGALTPPTATPLVCKAGVTNPIYCTKATRAQMCSGKVRVMIKRGKKTLAKKNITLKPTCSYSAKITIRKKMKHGKLTVSTRWLGNTLLGARNAKALKVKV
jgi:hypothetical protein